MEEKVKKSGLAIASLVLGLLSIIPGFGFLGFIAIILGIVSIVKIKKNGLRGKNMAISGIILGVSGIILGFVAYYMASSLLNGFLNNTGTVGKLKPMVSDQVLTQDMGILEVYKKQNGKYPQNLDQAVKEGYEIFPMDFYLRPIFYKVSSNGQSYEMRSLGADGKYGTSDDVLPTGKMNR